MLKILCYAMKISSKILVSFAIIGIVSILVSLVSLSGTSDIQELLSHSSDELDVQVIAAVEASSFAKRAEGHLMMYFTLDHEIDEEKFFERHASLQEQIDILKTNLDKRILVHVNLLQNAADTMIETGTRLIEIHNSDETIINLKENEELVLTFHQSASDARKEGVTIAELLSDNINQGISASSTKANEIFTMITIGVSLLIVVITVIAFLMIKTIRETMIAETKSMKQERFAIMGELSSRIVHDLKNPLTVLKASNDLLRIHKSNSDEKTIRLLNNQDKALSQMGNQIDEILDFVKSGQTKTKKANIADSMNYLLDSLPIPEEITVKSDLKDVMVDCNPGQIETVFANLIKNAIQAMNSKGKLTVNINSKDKLAQIQISDTGAGIPEEKIEEIFTPLYTTKKEGTGLGLVSCKSIVESYGGKILVKNNPDYGVTFTVELPLVKKESK